MTAPELVELWLTAIAISDYESAKYWQQELLIQHRILIATEQDVAWVKERTNGI